MRHRRLKGSANIADVITSFKWMKIIDMRGIFNLHN